MVRRTLFITFLAACCYADTGYNPPAVTVSDNSGGPSQPVQRLKFGSGTTVSVSGSIATVTATGGGTGGSGTSVYPATSTASFPFGLSASTFTISNESTIHTNGPPGVLDLVQDQYAGNYGEYIKFYLGSILNGQFGMDMYNYTCSDGVSLCASTPFIWKGTSGTPALSFDQNHHIATGQIWQPSINYFNASGNMSVGSWLDVSTAPVNGLMVSGNSLFSSTNTLALSTTGQVMIQGSTANSDTLYLSTAATGGNSIAFSTSSEISLNGSVGTKGQALTSAGAGTTPTWTTQNVIPPALSMTNEIYGITANTINISSEVICEVFSVPLTMTISSVTVQIGAISGSYDLGIYSSTGTRLASAGMTVAVTGRQSLPMTSPVTLTPGTYWACMVSNNTTLQFLSVTWPVQQPPGQQACTATNGNVPLPLTLPFPCGATRFVSYDIWVNPQNGAF